MSMLEHETPERTMHDEECARMRDTVAVKWVQESEHMSDWEAMLARATEQHADATDRLAQARAMDMPVEVIRMHVGNVNAAQESVERARYYVSREQAAKRFAR